MVQRCRFLPKARRKQVRPLTPPCPFGRYERLIVLQLKLFMSFQPEPDAGQTLCVLIGLLANDSSPVCFMSWTSTERPLSGSIVVYVFYQRAFYPTLNWQTQVWVDRKVNNKKIILITLNSNLTAIKKSSYPRPDPKLKYATTRCDVISN